MSKYGSDKLDVHQFRVERVEGTEGAHGKDMKYFLDGKPLKYVKNVSIELPADSFNVVTITFIAGVEVGGIGVREITEDDA